MADQTPYRSSAAMYTMSGRPSRITLTASNAAQPSEIQPQARDLLPSGPMKAALADSFPNDKSPLHFDNRLFQQPAQHAVGRRQTSFQPEGRSRVGDVSIPSQNTPQSNMEAFNQDLLRDPFFRQLAARSDATTWSNMQAATTSTPTAETAATRSSRRLYDGQTGLAQRGASDWSAGFPNQDTNPSAQPSASTAAQILPPAQHFQYSKPNGAHDRMPHSSRFNGLNQNQSSITRDQTQSVSSTSRASMSFNPTDPKHPLGSASVVTRPIDPNPLSFAYMPNPFFIPRRDGYGLQSQTRLSSAFDNRFFGRLGGRHAEIADGAGGAREIQAGEDGSLSLHVSGTRLSSPVQSGASTFPSIQAALSPTPSDEDLDSNSSQSPSTQDTSSGTATPSTALAPAQTQPAATNNRHHQNNIINRMNNGSTYGVDIRARPPIQARPPFGIDIGAVEINTFFPNALQHPIVAMRLVKAGWTKKDLAKAQLHATNNLTQQKLKTNEDRIQKQLGAGGKAYFAIARGTRWSKNQWLQGHAMFDELTADGWKFRHHYDASYDDLSFEDVPLASIIAPVMDGNWPQGADRLLLTQCLEFARANPHLNLTTANFDWIIQNQGLQAPAHLDSTHDVQALRTLQNTIADP